MIGGSKIYGVWVDVGGQKDYGEDFRAQIRRVASNKSATSLGIFCYPTPDTPSWSVQLDKLIQDVGQNVPVALLNFLPKDDSIQNIRANDGARHKTLVSFKSAVATTAYENSFALLEAFVPIGNLVKGLDGNAKNKFMANKFEKMASMVVNQFKTKAGSESGDQVATGSLINPALLPESPAKTASNGRPIGNTVHVANQPDRQPTTAISNLTSLVNSNAQVMQKMAASAQHANLAPPTLMGQTQELLRV